MTSTLRGVLPVLVAFHSAAALAGDAVFVQHEGVWIMKLSGTREEMARTHGELIRETWQDTALPYFASKLDKSIEQTYIVKDVPLLGDIAGWGIDVLALKPLIRRIPDEDRAMLAAFAEGAGVPLEDALKAYVVPDAGQWLLATIFGSQKLSKAFISGLSPFGCTSFVTGKGGAGDAWIHARNLDYDSFGIFDRSPAVIYFDPSEPGAQSYMSFTSLGIHTAGITAMNASGIGLSLHQVMIDDVSTHGTSILSINERVIREARTLDEAVEILRSSRYAGSWAVQLSSARERRAVSVEVSARRFHVREMEGNDLVMTNHVFGDELRAKEFAFSYAYPIDSRERYRALEAELASLEQVSVQSAIDLISGAFHRMDSGADPVIPMLGTVAKGNNIQSVVMMPELKLAYIAVPSHASAKPVDGSYVAVPLDFEALGSNESFLSALDDVPAALTSSSPLPAAALEAQTLLRQAAAAATDYGRYEVARALLKKASGLQPAEPHYALVAALYAFRQAGSEEGTRHGEALDDGYVWLEVAASLDPSAYQQALIRLFRARYYDLIGRREDAIREYRLASDKAFSKALTEAAQAGLKRRYKAKGLKKIVVDALLGDVYRF